MKWIRHETQKELPSISSIPIVAMIRLVSDTTDCSNGSFDIKLFSPNESPASRFPVTTSFLLLTWENS